MYSYSMVQWIFFFYFYCFFGWCFESAYVSLKKRKWVNRGFVRGPFLPLYGTGAIMMLLVSMPFQENLLLTYFAGCIGATALEYVTGVVMEALFKVRYWDYSNQKFNFQGHICLGSSLAWGGLTILMTHVIHRPVEQLVLAVPGRILGGITFLISLVFAADFAVSFRAALDLRDVLLKMEQAREELERMQKRLDVVIAVANEALDNAQEGIQEKIGGMQEGIQEKIEDVREWLGERQEGMLERREENRAHRHYSLGREELQEQIEAKLRRVREALNTSDSLNEWREELQELALKFRMNRENWDKKQYLKDGIRRSMLKNNPGMVSGRFKEALEELKEALEEYRNQDGDQKKK